MYKMCMYIPVYTPVCIPKYSLFSPLLAYMFSGLAIWN